MSKQDPENPSSVELWVKKKRLEDSIWSLKKDIILVTSYCVFLVAIVLTVVLLTWAFVRDVDNSRKNTSYHKEKHPTWYDVDFPEDEFAPSKKNVDEYFMRVERGYTNMKTHKIVIGGMARNIGHVLEKTVARLQRIGKLFLDYRIVILENDSKDNTRNILKDWKAENPRVELVPLHEDSVEGHIYRHPLKNNSLYLKSHMERMANLRNRLLNYIKSAHSKNFSHVLMCDLDIDGPISLDGMATCFSYGGWDVMTANGISFNIGNFNLNSTSYFDIFSLVFLDQHPRRNVLATFLKSSVSMKHRRGDIPMQVKSAFGGAAIYTMESLVKSAAQYSHEYSEHVCLHLHMADNGYGKIFINPSFLLLHVLRLNT